MGHISGAGRTEGAVVDVEIGAVAAGGVGNKGALGEACGRSRHGFVPRVGGHVQHRITLAGGEGEGGSRVIYPATVVGAARIEAFGIRSGDTLERVCEVRASVAGNGCRPASWGAAEGNSGGEGAGWRTRGTPEFHPGLDNFGRTLPFHPRPGEAASGDTGDLTVVITVDGDRGEIERVAPAANVADVEGRGRGGRGGGDTREDRGGGRRRRRAVRRIAHADLQARGPAHVGPRGLGGGEKRGGMVSQAGMRPTIRSVPGKSIGGGPVCI